VMRRCLEKVATVWRTGDSGFQLESGIEAAARGSRSRASAATRSCSCKHSRAEAATRSCSRANLPSPLQQIRMHRTHVRQDQVSHMR
jgi:hypothetical protein